jgi:hypothetical protein
VLESYLENQDIGSINLLPRGSGFPPDKVHDQVDFLELILDPDEWTDTNLALIDLCHDAHKDVKAAYCPGYACTHSHNMPSTESDTTLMDFYKHLIHLNDSALTSSPALGPPLDGYEHWAMAHDHPRNIYDARAKLASSMRGSSTYTDVMH